MIFGHKQMTYMFDIWRLCFSQALCLASAAAKASSWNGFGCARYFVRPLQVLVRVLTTRALAWPGVRGHVKLRQEGPYLRASGAIAYNVLCMSSGTCTHFQIITKLSVPLLIHGVMCRFYSRI